MPSDTLAAAALPLTLLVCLLAAAGVAATPGAAVGEPLTVAAPQDPAAAAEAALALDRSTRRLIQHGLRNEGFDPGTPDGLFGPRTRAAIRRWQEARGVPPTGYLSRTDADRLTAAGAPPPPSRSATAATTAAPDSTAQLPAANNPDSAAAAVAPPRTAGGTLRPEPPPDGLPSTRPTALGQLPPAILLDSYLLRAEQSVRDDDSAGARAAMAQIDALQAEHDLEIPAEYHHRYARVWRALANWERSQASAIRYLALTGRDGENYLDALTVMNEATAAIDALDRERERRAAEHARQQRQLSATRDVLAQMEFVRIPAGQFTMRPSATPPQRGWPRTHPDSYYQSRHVFITQPFAIGRHEVTRSEWETVLGSIPRYQQTCARCPITSVGWDDVQRFVAVLNATSTNGHTYRLPTEAEWEYAAQAGGHEHSALRDLDDFAWHRDNSEGQPHPVGLKQPTSLGLHDMLGNVSEWTQDFWGWYPGGMTVEDPRGPRSASPDWVGPTYTVRGCNYRSPPQCNDSQPRDFSIYSRPWIGFRLVRTDR